MQKSLVVVLLLVFSVVLAGCSQATESASELAPSAEQVLTGSEESGEDQASSEDESEESDDDDDSEDTEDDD